MPPVNADGDATRAAVAHDDGLDALLSARQRSGRLSYSSWQLNCYAFANVVEALNERDLAMEYRRRFLAQVRSYLVLLRSTSSTCKTIAVYTTVYTL